MAIVESSGYAHVRITVTDIAVSKAFYDRVFGWTVAIDNTAKAGQPGVADSPEEFYGGCIYQTPSGALFGLRPVAPTGQRFDSEHTGLDHVSFLVPSRDDLVTARDALEADGVPHGEIIEFADSGIAILSFSDPDGVHLELTAQL